MTDIIDINKFRMHRELSGKFHYVDEEGVDWYCFGVEYLLTGEKGTGSWSFRLWATSWDDAQARLLAIQKSAVIYGQLFEEIPA